ncbi:adenosylcobinamide-phosphate synthase CbiB [Allorhizobium undicola]|uniref:adenosylcobinamide-phosphate synthase CbiB n=1 Tax=Allorhizobium undicola TaxID=78527 RepID=UPI000481976C|nr:adenosylcobinamide-phosphate synthase CbiB [Allorhizobium undicola]
MTEQLLLLLAALLLDRAVGDPPWLWARLPHPVVLFGKAISLCDRLWNRPMTLSDGHEHSRRQRRRNTLRGVFAITVLLALALAVGAVLHWVFRLAGPPGLVLEVVLTAIFLAQKSLLDHVSAVAVALRRNGISGGRYAVSMIVGRDTSALDEAGICRAALESLSENFADGVVAPALWYGLLGLPGIMAYKMLNTADSMIGHKNEKYQDFGWAAARLDDLANWPAARLSGWLIVLAAAVNDGRQAAARTLAVMLADHGLHRSPNSGWPEAACAGALDVALAGPRVYNGERVNEPMMNAAGRRDISAGHVVRGLMLIDRAFQGLIAATLIAVFLLAAG